MMAKIRHTGPNAAKLAQARAEMEQKSKESAAAVLQTFRDVSNRLGIQHRYLNVCNNTIIKFDTLHTRSRFVLQLPSSRRGPNER